MSNARYSETFKRDAVEKCKLHGSINWVADMLGVQPNTLRRWVREYEENSKMLVAEKNC